MIKISLENNETPIKYILSSDKLQPFSEIVDFKVDNSPLVTTSLHSINELGKQLLKAAADGDVQEIKTLLTKGSPFTSDWLGTSPLHLAAQNNNLEICDLLLRAGISKDARNKVDRTPLHLAAFEGHFQIVESLVLHGADINCRDMLNMTPLHWAVQNGHTSIVEFLVKNGAQINVCNKFDLTPQDIAMQINKLDIAELLQGYDNDSQTATENLIMQLQEDNEDGVEIQENDENNVEPNNALDPVIINLDSNSEITNISTEQEDYNETDHVIISLDGEDNKNNPTENNKDDQTPTVLTSTPITNFKLIDGVLHPADDSDGNFSAVKLLQDHGITMLPNDSEEINILNAAMESGHSVVLTDVGKEVLNTVKEEEEKTVRVVKTKKIITVTPDQFTVMANNNLIKNLNIKDAPTKPNVKRVLMKKNRPTPFGNVIKIQNNATKSNNKADIEHFMKLFVKANKTIEEYKVKLRKTEMEAERYKMQLKLLMDTS